VRNSKSLTIILRITSLLLTGLFKGHKKPTVIRRNYEFLVGTSVQSTAITPHRGFNISDFKQVAISGGAKEYPALTRDSRGHALYDRGRDIWILLDRQTDLRRRRHSSPRALAVRLRELQCSLTEIERRSARRPLRPSSHRSGTGKVARHERCNVAKAFGSPPSSEQPLSLQQQRLP
jgi:hypothetical protein